MENSLLSSATMIAVLNLISKFLGFVREMMTAHSFGTGAEMDAYTTARTATIIIMGTIGAALNSSMMPVIATVQQNHGEKARLKFFNKMVNLVLVTSLLIVVLSIIAAPILVKIIASKLDKERFDMAVTLTRIGMPLVFALGLNYLYTALLQSSRKFFAPAASGIPYNITFFVFLGLLGTDASIKGMMITTVIASFLQFAIMIPDSRKLKYRYSPTLKINDKYTRKVGTMVVPVLIGSSVQQINTIVDRTLSSGLQEGSMSALSYASRVSDVVVSVFIAAITTVVFPLLADAFVKNDKKKLIEIIEKGMNVILMITIPATVGLVLLSEPLIRLFFERGKFDVNSTIMTSGALAGYSIGLVAIAVRLLLNKVFYSLQDTKTPMINGVISVIINLIVSIILVEFLGLNGLAIGTSIAAIYSSINLFHLLRKRLNNFSMKSIIRGSIRFLLSSFVMGIFVYVVNFIVAPSFESSTIKNIILLLSVVIAVIIYFAMCILLKVPELMDIIEQLKKRYKKSVS